MKLPEFKPWQSITIVLIACLILGEDYAQGHWGLLDRLLVGMLALLFLVDLTLWWIQR